MADIKTKYALWKSSWDSLRLIIFLRENLQCIKLSSDGIFCDSFASVNSLGKVRKQLKVIWRLGEVSDVCQTAFMETRSQCTKPLILFNKLNIHTMEIGQYLSFLIVTVLN